LLALAAFTSTASADHSWKNYHWARQDKAILKVGDNVSPSWDQHLATAVGATEDGNGDPVEDGHNDWDKPATTEGYTFTDKLDLTIVPGTAANTNTCLPPPPPEEPEPEKVHVQVCNASYGNNGWLGLAQIWVNRRTGHITEATTKLNDTYFNQERYDTPAWRNVVMCQELGHDFGLTHTNENFTNRNLGSCMDYTNDPDGGGSYGRDNQYPGGVRNRKALRRDALPFHDYSQLASIYKHSDSQNTVDANSANERRSAASERALNRLSELGERIHRSEEGRVELYSRDLGDGDELISRVIRVVEDRTSVSESTDGTETTDVSYDHHDHDH
jgi:hypothetical protein